MVYAVLMLLVLLTLAAIWRKHPLQVALFLLTIACILVHYSRHDNAPYPELLRIG